MASVSYKKGKILFFGGKMLQHQNVPATKRLGTKSYGSQNVDTKKLKILFEKCSPPHNNENILKWNLFWLQKFL